ncbi:COG4186 Predicted phosphoesterase or phosphohydrolase [uncultured Caudovirales phage]|uniref:COG4186 Predicted phosphoesterase or phosphohydrolase n=1 Tax=uncultured Caudovirales phage TaxID=2100421 RepID=A0A6J5RHA1_9CAUD|nr:COG4186 Predicted phosphoesterase or phosphohydrolase [uncultured Caudovirales phage]
MTTFFTSDLHINHFNIIKYTNRPFTSTKEMDEALIDNWNAVVKPGDTVYNLGDFGFGSADYLISVNKRLNGHKHFVWGNHDKELQRYKGDLGFESTSFYKEIRVDNQKIILSHYAFLVWNGSHKGSWNLFGHSHHTLPININSLSTDVGVDGPDFNYTPVSFEQVREIMKNRKFVPLDHHKD